MRASKMSPMSAGVQRLVERVARYAEFGHVKRDSCVVRHVARLATAPAAVPQQAGLPWAEAKSWYDLLDNPDVRVQDLRDLRLRVVQEEWEAVPELLVVHDLTEVDYTRQEAKQDRRSIGDGGGWGYEYYPSLVMDPGTQRFLGVVHDALIAQDGPDDAEAVDYDGDPWCAALPEAARVGLSENHRHQLACRIRSLAPVFGERPVIHVADREFDDLPAMAAARESGQDFVLRALANRTVEVPGEAPSAGAMPAGAMPALIAELPLEPYKDIPLDSRGHVVSRGRPHRVASVSIGACSVRLFRPFTRNRQRYVKPPHPLEVNVVVIRELEAPPKETPLCWVLFTSLPAATFEQQARVGYLYELRWRIEEYFKLLKGGFGLERARYDNAEKTAKALVFYSLAALALLDLKADSGLPATGPLDEESYRRVKHAMAHPQDESVDPQWALLALVLTLGGWLGRKSDPVGPTVLMRGLLRLTATLQALRQFPDLLQQFSAADQSPLPSEQNAYNS